MILKKNNLIKVKKGSEYQYEVISDRTIVKGIVAPDPSDFFVEDTLDLQLLRLLPGSQQQYWLTINAEGIAPGLYRGNIIFQVGDDEVLVPLAITILSFDLKETKIIHSIYYRGFLNPDGEGSISSEQKDRKQLLLDFKNMKAHGIKNPGVYQPIRTRKKWKDYTAKSLENAMHEYFKIRRAAGFENSELYYLGVTTGKSKSDSAISSVVRGYEKVKTIAKEYGFNTIYLYGCDEAKGNDLIAQKKYGKRSGLEMEKYSLLVQRVMSSW